MEKMCVVTAQLISA